ncbi:hypothetical protein [Corallococcus exiguus]|uniref:Uncharacterized protein n=1 Tax=Corallococcus exiguus TaxID=83462 RepID=A0A7X4YET9_9BACT|nr:hypothetical protein [Corallococcus exiguus]NBC43414.1 hypothetical protein [Corallococcus exiguus]TNV49737.1 hypothetical protein FH620_39975 [Corallococcus exiguus]
MASRRTVAQAGLTDAQKVVGLEAAVGGDVDALLDAAQLRLGERGVRPSTARQREEAKAHRGAETQHVIAIHVV